jgi:PBSX family phage terminase large subunit
MTRAREKAAIGAVGSGKTIALCADAILLGLQQPGSRILIARQTVPSLRDTTEHEFLQLINSIPEELEGIQKKTLYDLCEIRKSGGHVDRIIFPNGSEFLFRSLDDWRKLMSLNLAAFYVDEASEIAVESYLGLLTRIRQTEPTQQAQRQGHRKITRQLAAICTNPNGHDWIWEYFVKDSESHPGRRYFRSTSFDNPTLYDANGEPGPYLQGLLTMPEIWVRRYVLCEFDAFEGQIYEFSYDTHVHTHFEPPKDWERAMGLDWGLRNPTAIVWWARKPGTTKWYQYREWQSYDPTDQGARETAVTPTVHEVAAVIHQLERGETIKWRVADPAIRQRQSDSGKSVHYWFTKHGLHFQLGMKDYSSRINAFGQLLSNREYSCSDQNPMTSMAIQQYRWSDISSTRDTDGPERPHKKNDHLVNACEYLATIFAATKAPAPKVEKPTLHDEIWATVKRQIKQRRNKRTYSYGRY